MAASSPLARAVMVVAMCVCLSAPSQAGELTPKQKALLDTLHFRPVFMIPGFASSRLRVWRSQHCEYGPSFGLRDDVWLSTTQVLLARKCWLNCMANIHPINQTDNPIGCKIRPDEGLDAITELDPGYITGPLSNVWKDCVEMYGELGFEPGRNLFAAPYDFRLPMARMEERDGYFLHLKKAIETAVSLFRRTQTREKLPVEETEGPAVVIAHSHGNTVFRYFLEWLKHEIGTHHQLHWISQHIGTYIAVGAPLLGAVEPVKALFAGVTFGLPISEPQVRNLSIHWASQLGMQPVVPSKSHPQHIRAGNGQSFPANYAYVDLSSLTSLNMTVSRRRKETNGAMDVDPSSETHVSNDTTDTSTLTPEPSPPPHECSVGDSTWVLFPCDEPDAPKGSSPGSPRRLYHSMDVADGSMFEDMSSIDEAFSVFQRQKQLYYDKDPVLNTLQPWSRPPIRNVVAAYGINRKTPVGYRYSVDPLAPSGSKFVLEDTVYEYKNTVVADSGVSVRPVALEDSKAQRVSGDGTVPYFSLSWAHTWLGEGTVNISRVPSNPMFSRDEVQVCVECDVGQWTCEHNGVGANTFFQTAEVDSAGAVWETQVWELDDIDHRKVISSTPLMTELRATVLERASYASTLEDTVKAHRLSTMLPLRATIAQNLVAEHPPHDDDGCYWDYMAASCAWPSHCEYRYTFGDLRLSQSCRLKTDLKLPDVHDEL